MKYKYLVIASMMLMALFSVSAAFASVAATEINTNGPVDLVTRVTSVPAPISYVLSKNAEQVKIEVLPVDVNGAPVGPAVKTWTFTAPDPACAKGKHIYDTDATKNTSPAIWQGTTDSGAVAPSGDYKVKITATGAVATDFTKLVPLWESAAATTGDSDGWRVISIAVNNNPNSPFFGRIYVSNYQTSGTPSRAQAVHEFLPDGSLKSIFPKLPSNGGSSPWGVAVDGDDHVWVTDRSKQSVFRFKYNPSTAAWVIDSNQITGISYGRGLAVTGAGDNLKLAGTDCASTAGAGGAKISTAQGDPPSTFSTSASMNEDTFCQPTMAADGKIYIAGVQSYGTGPGSVSRWDFAVPTGTTASFHNNNLTRATGVTITPDQQTMWVARMASLTGYTDSRDGTTTDAAGKLFVKLPLANFETANPYDAANSGGAKFYGFGTNTSNTKVPDHIAADSFGNVAATGGQQAYTTVGYVFGLYEEPSATAPVNTTKSWQTIRWSGGDFSPFYVNGSTSLKSIPCDGATKTTITVNAQDMDGYSDIGSCKLYCPEMGYGVAGDPTTGVPMMRSSGSGKDAQYKLDISAPATAPTGPTTIYIYVNDVHSGPLAGRGSINLTVTGGEISGQIIEGATNSIPAANVTVVVSGTFQGQPYSRECVTDANGFYSVNVNPGTGWSVDVKRTHENITTPAEFNPVDETKAFNDWPKAVDVQLNKTTTVSTCRVWPLQVSQVFYHFQDTNDPTDPASDYLAGAREVCVKGIVMRPAADTTTGQKGNDGFYWIYDTLHAATQIGAKIRTLAGEPAPKMGDMIVVNGTYTREYGWTMGAVVPFYSPTILESGKALPVARKADRTSLNGNLYGGLYGAIKNRVVSGVVTPDAPLLVGTVTSPSFNVKIPTSATDATPVDYLVQVNTPETTGITLPVEGDSIYLAGVLDETSIWNLGRGLRPAIPSDVELAHVVPFCGAVRDLADDTPVMVKSRRITAVGDGNNGLPADVAYIEDANRSSAIRIHSAGMVANKDAGLGDQVTVFGVVKTTAQGEKYIEVDTANGGQFNREYSKLPLAAVTMSSKAANDAKSKGLFVKMVGKVEDKTAGGDESFILNDGGVRMKVYCGSIAAPATNNSVKVRGVLSSDGTKAALLVGDVLDIADSRDAEQPLPVPGKYKYFRDYLIIGPFTKTLTATDNQTKTDELMATDFIAEATQGTSNPITEADLAPKIGDTVTYNGQTLTWHRIKSTGTGGNADLVDINAELPGTGYKEFSVAYLVTYIYTKDMLTDVDMTLGADDQFRVFVNKAKVYEDNHLQGTSYAKYGNTNLGMGFMLNPGANCIVAKVVNGGTGFGFCGNLVWVGLWDSLKAGTFGNGAKLPDGTMALPTVGYYADKPAGFPY